GAIPPAADSAAIAQRPLPDSCAELRHLSDRLNSFIEICGTVEADTLAREMVNEKYDGLLNERENIQNLGEGGQPLSESERASIAGFMARMDAHTREANVLTDFLSPHRTATTVVGLDVHAR